MGVDQTLGEASWFPIGIRCRFWAGEGVPRVTNEIDWSSTYLAMIGLDVGTAATSAVGIVVFVATGVLSTSPLPHSGEMTGVLANVQTFWAYLWAR